MDFIKNKISHKRDIAKEFSIYLLIFGTFFLPFVHLSFANDWLSTPKMLFLYLLGIVILGLWIFRAMKNKEITLRRSILDVSIIGILITTVLSTIFSVSTFEASLFGRGGEFVLHAAAIFVSLLWVWLLVQHVTSPKIWQKFFYTLVTSGSLVAIFFVVDKLFFLNIFRIPQMISTSNSVFGIFLAVSLVLNLGFLMSRNRSIFARFIPILGIIASFFILLQMDVTVAWVVFFFGAFLILIFGSTKLDQVSNSSLVVVFSLLLLSLGFVFFETPSFVRQVIPLEISLGVRPSFDIVWNTVVENPKNFLFGSGPGTFVQSFSLYRSPAFNVNSIAWTTRFSTPYSTILAFLSEYGLVGFMALLFLFLLISGAMFGAWGVSRVHRETGIYYDGGLSGSPDNLSMIRLDGSVIFAAFLAATVGMGVSFYSMAMWWLWWVLLGLSLLAASLIMPNVIREEKVSLLFSPQHSLFVSFVIVLIFIFSLLFGGFALRSYAGDIAYARAEKSASLDDREKFLLLSIEYRNHYAPYHSALAKLYLDKARLVASPEISDGGDRVETVRNSGAVAEAMSLAVSQAKIATEISPKSVDSWETLAIVYLSARQIAEDANDWAISSLIEAIKLEPTNSLLHWRLGNAYTYASDFDKAEDAYKEVINLKPDYVAAYIDLSRVYEEKGKIDMAISLYQIMFPLIKSEPDIMFNLGRLFFNRRTEGDLEKAEEVWRAALAISPEHSNTLYSLGILEESRGNVIEALDYFGEVGRLNPDNLDIKTKIDSLK